MFGQFSFSRATFVFYDSPGGLEHSSIYYKNNALSTSSISIMLCCFLPLLSLAAASVPAEVSVPELIQHVSVGLETTISRSHQQRRDASHSALVGDTTCDFECAAAGIASYFACAGACLKTKTGKEALACITLGCPPVAAAATEACLKTNPACKKEREEQAGGVVSIAADSQLLRPEDLQRALDGVGSAAELGARLEKMSRTMGTGGATVEDVWA